MAQIIKAPAKINIFLQILGDREDGFTEIISLMQAVSLYDTIRVQRAERGLELSSNEPSLPLDSSNTVAKAWAVMCAAVGKELGAKIDIGKKIPMQSGLGGGSSDAAGAMIGIAREWGLKIDRETMKQLGAAVGSDVPFFFGGGSSLVEGRGEIVTDIAVPTDYALLLVKPPFGISTKDAYRRAKNGLTVGNKKRILNYLHQLTSISKLVELGNALERPFFEAHPGAMEIKKKLLRAGAVATALSGSGSCFFGVFENIDTAEIAKGKFKEFWRETALPAKMPEI
ncbi:MAG TPA: 4-(cytidine 5'-diphospho)-2-C-methyl-D-erythritol kinase [candidate division Zixibacteria bacterium]|nr:4-(cytidine 5'-diphospho)-2-C-methyl-D-erythritol kinase [candidate division Zixibacteria bacterium]